MNKKHLFYIYGSYIVVFVIMLIFLNSINVHADVTYPTTINDIQSSGKYVYGDGTKISIDSRDLKNLHDELYNLGIYSENKISSYETSLATQSGLVDTGKKNIASKINTKTGTTTIPLTPVPSWDSLKSGVDSVYTKGYNTGKQNSALKKIGSSAGTYNLSSYPGYKNFTVNGNIFVSSYITANGSGGHNANGDRVSKSIGLTVNYNASTGVLTVTNGTYQETDGVTLKLNCICNGVYITAQ